jgi:hypothetical protein
MTRSVIVLAAILPAAGQLGGGSAATAGAPVTVRTERYPRPPYSGATYYVYERGGVPICTKLEVCNKYGDCAASYHAGRYRAPEDRGDRCAVRDVARRADPRGQAEAPRVPRALPAHPALAGPPAHPGPAPRPGSG